MVHCLLSISVNHVISFTIIQLLPMAREFTYSHSDGYDSSWSGEDDVGRNGQISKRQGGFGARD